MEHFYILKTVIAGLLISLFCSTTLLANNSIEPCRHTTDSILVNQNVSRNVIAINGATESLVLSNLEPGANYTLWIASEEVGPDCILSLSKEAPDSRAVLEMNHTMTFEAEDIAQSIFIQNENCHQRNAFFANLSIIKKERDTSSPNRSLMGIATTGGQTPEQLIEEVLIGGGCFDISNIQAIGNLQGMGTFSNGTSSINIEEGVILASGNIANSAGPNDITNITTAFGDNSGDPDLNILATSPVIDAVGLEFDFTPVLNTIEFRYVFASDEYCDFVNSNFNDVFGFFISGPGITGPYTNGGANIALVPGTNDDVAINSVNYQTNAAYYFDNVTVGQPQGPANGCTAAELANPGVAEMDIEYDGFTGVFTATANVQACETYHIRLVVADVNDGLYDSAVFLEANSFNLGGEVSLDVDFPALDATGTAYEGCAGDGYIIFERPQDANLNLPFDVYFDISPSSTATNGVDYSNIPPFITIPAGQTQYLLPLTIYEDFIVEGTETLIIELQNPCSCQDASVEILISDTPELFVETPDLEFCNETSTVLVAAVAGGVPGYSYQWSNGGFGPTTTVDAVTGTQTFTVTVTDECGNGMISTSTITVSEEPFAIIEGFGEVCDANPNSVLTVNFIGNGPWDLSYMIDGVPQLPIIGIVDNPYFLVASTPGVYTISGVFVNGCPGIGDGSGIITPTIFNSFAIPEAVSCPENFDGSIDLLVTGGTPNYSFQWSNDIYTEDLDNLGPGVYAVTITDQNGCTHTESTEVVAPPPMTLELTDVQGVTCEDSLAGSANLTVSGGVPDYTYLWDNGSILEDPTDLSGGSHTVTVTDLEGCMSEAMVTIPNDINIPVAVAEAVGILTCDSLAVSISGANSSGTGNLSYTWTGIDGSTISNDTMVDVLDPGTYTLLVTNLDNGCNDETTVTIDQDIVPPVPVGVGGLLTCDETEVSLDGSASSGIGTLGFSWMNDSGTELGTLDSLIVNSEGTYTLIVTDGSNGCSAETTVAVTLDENLPTPDATASGILTCDLGMVTIDGAASSGAGSLTYEWLNPDGDSISIASQVEVTESGTYTLIITDGDNGCTAETTVPVNQNIDEPIPDALADGILDCVETMVNLDASGSNSNGGLTYQWLDGGTEIGTTPNIEVIATGTYTLIVTDALSGCTAETEVMVDENINEPMPDATVLGLLTCDEELVTLDGAASSGIGNITYQWLATNGDLLSNEPSFEVGDIGNYTLIITDDFNGCTAEASLMVDENIQDPLADAGDNGILNCDETTVTLDGAGSSTGSEITYTWLNESNVDVGDELSIDVVEAGTYTLVVTDTNNGCTAEADVLIDTDDNVPQIEAIVDGVLNCETLAATLDGGASTGNGTLAFQWLDDTDTEISITEMAEVNTAGTYTLIITDSDNGCSAQSTVEVLENIQIPMPDILDPDLLTCDFTMVELDANSSVGLGTIIYQWEDSAGGDLGTNATIEVNTAGTYLLTITDDSNGCTAETEITVNENINDPTPNALADGILTCDNLTIMLDGSASTGLGNLEYQWLDQNNIPFSTMASNEVNTAGTYTLIISNESNGCTAETTIDVDQDIIDPLALADAEGILNCETTAASLSGINSSGEHPLDFEWFDTNGLSISNSAELDVEDSGVFTLVVTDQINGCSNETTAEVLANFETPSPAANADGILTCDNLSVLLDGSASTSTGGLSYEWFNTSNVSVGMEASLEVLETGTYTLVLTDQNSACTESIIVEVDENIINPEADAGTGNTLTCDIETVFLNGENSSTGNNIAYEWLNSGGVTVSEVITAEVGEAGEYTLIVTNTENGCTDNAVVTVVPDENLPLADAGLGDVLTCDNLEAILDASGSSTGTDISYEWLDPNGVSLDSELTLEVNIPGTYTLIVTDGMNGCSATSSVEIDQDILTPDSDPGDNPTLTCDQTAVVLNGAGSTSPLGNLEYQWLDSNGLPIGINDTIEVTMAGAYTLIVTAENGCTNAAEVEVLLDANVPVADPGQNGLLNCTVPMLTLGGANSSTGATIAYQWTNSNNEVVGMSQYLEASTPDTYTLMVFNNANDCETSAEVIVDQDIALPEVDAGAGGLLTCEMTEIVLGGIGTSNGANFEFEWTDLNDQVISNDSVHFVTEPGTYTIAVFNTENGCEISETITIDQNVETPVAVTGPGGVLTCDVSEIVLDGGGSTGANLSYQWLNESGVELDLTPQIEVGETGVYTLVVTNDTNGCSAASDVEVIPDENLPTAIADEDGILTCAVDQVLIDAGNSTSISGNISFEWTDPNNVFLTNDPDLMVGTPGIYTVLVTDTDNGCTTTALVEVPQDIMVPEALAGENDTLTCLTTTLELNGSGINGNNFAYQWLDENNAPFANTPSTTVNTAGVYTLMVTNQDNGCTANDQIEVIPDVDLPLALAGLGGTLTCTVESIILDASASDQGPTMTYEWQNTNGTLLSEDLTMEVNQPGDYIIIVTNNENSCVAQDVVTVDQNTDDPEAAIDGIGPIELNCDINQVVLNGENSMPFNNLTFDWSTNNGNITTATDLFEIGVDEAGIYTLTIIDQVNGCTDTQTYMVGQDIGLPSAFINDPAIINCNVSQVDVIANNTSGNGNFAYDWIAADGSGIVDGQNTLNLTVSESGTYILTIVNTDNACTETAEIEVLADLETPDAAADVEDELDCVTESVQLSGTGSSVGNNFNYEWQGSGLTDGAYSLSPTVNQAGLFTLVVTNTTNGCTETDEIAVVENTNVPNDVLLEVKPPACPGDEGSIEIIEVTGGEEPYLYSIDGGDSFYDISLFFDLEPGAYDFVVQDAIGCEYDELIDIASADNIFAQLGLDLEIELGDSIQLDATVNVPEWELSSIEWTPAESLSCGDCLDPFATPDKTTTYTLTVVNESGCPATADILLRVRKDRDLYIPNAFTPHNSDGINDIFHIFSDGKSVRSINTFQVFDRWGELIFEDYNFLPDDPAHGWDGYFRGEPMNPAVFVYWAEVEFIDGEVILFKGDVTLVQ